MSELLCSLVDGRAAASVPIDDRGLLYGDGLFETVLMADAHPVWWDQHLERLSSSAERLGIACPPDAVWASDLQSLVNSCVALPERAVLRMTLTRGSSGRGYAPQQTDGSRRILSMYPAPTRSAPNGLRLRTCSLRLAHQPALAGMKHLNRLEQVMARLEWSQLPADERDRFDEGLLIDSQGDAVCATLGNLLWKDPLGWHTPPVDRCGIAGLCRAQLLSLAWIDERRLPAAELLAVEALAVCNSVRGILPVLSLDGLAHSQCHEAVLLRQRWLQQEPTFDF